MEALSNRRRENHYSAVEVEVSGGTLANGGVLMTPLNHWNGVLNLNPELRNNLVITVAIRNTGTLPVFVEAVEMKYKLDHEREQPELQLLGRDDYPHLNPTLPKEVPVGASMTWIVSLDTIQWVASRAASTRFSVSAFYVEVRLATSERITSDQFPVSMLPL